LSTSSVCGVPEPFVYVQQVALTPGARACLDRREAVAVRMPMTDAPIIVWFVTHG
jgi:hypothetical protein